MKGLFPQFDPNSERDFENIWREALFVFDTNVLLNLYRYQATTRDKLLEVLTQLADRMWIPHHVALEFQRNRMKVIADQNQRFHEVRKAIQSAADGLKNDLGKLQLVQRHSLIDPERITSGFDELAKKFVAELEETQGKQQSITAPDPLKDKVEELFDSRVGNEPKDQAELDAIYKKAIKRYELGIPPGFMDQAKDKNEPDEYLHNEIVYKRKFGDYLVWQQLLDHAKAVEAKSVIFVTDDGKEDWWWILKSGGPKTLGPRPELVDEAKSKAGILNFLMYKPSAFLKFASEVLTTEVPEETLQEVRDVSAMHPLKFTPVFNALGNKSRNAESAVYAWLKERYDSVEEARNAFFDFLVSTESARFGISVKLVSELSHLDRVLTQFENHSLFVSGDDGFDGINLFLIAASFSRAEKMSDYIERNSRLPRSLRSKIAIFVLQGWKKDEQLIPYFDYSSDGGLSGP